MRTLADYVRMPSGAQLEMYRSQQRPEDVKQATPRWQARTQERGPTAMHEAGTHPSQRSPRVQRNVIGEAQAHAHTRGGGAESFGRRSQRYGVRPEG
jgi:hypothetical protein